MKRKLLLLLIVINITLNAQTREADSLALVEIYNALDGDNWNINNNWLSDVPMDDWYSVTVRDDRVTVLRIVLNNASGDFPLAIYRLTALEQLSISSTAINGPLPEGIMALTELQELSMSQCGLTGDLPSGFDQMPNLRRLSFPSNSLTGNLPEAGPSLNYVNVNSNQFTGEIPQSWANDQMWQIRLSNNLLTGKLDFIGEMTGLDGATIFNNDWDTQPLPDWLDELPVLRTFSCSNCNLTGEVPFYDFSNSPELYQIILEGNHLSGDVSNIIPLPTDEDGVWVDISNNNFNGELPLHQLTKVRVFDASDNHFTSLSTPSFDDAGRVDLVGNRFTIADLVGSIEQLLLDSVNVYYGSQLPIEVPDTITVYEATEITLEAREDFPGVEYQWLRFNQPIEGATESTYTVQVDEDSEEYYYDCILTYPLFAEEDGYMVRFYRGRTTILSDITSDIRNINNRYHVVLYPNPAFDILQVTSELDFIYAPYQLFSSAGSELQSGVISNDHFINVANLQAQLMILKIETDKGVIIIKLDKR